MKAALRRLDRATRSRNAASKTHRLVGSWNVRTMQSDLSVSDKGAVVVQGGGLGKLPNLISSLDKYNVGLAAISEHRWKGQGELQHGGWLFLFCGLTDDSKSAGGAGLTLSPEWVKAWGLAGREVVYKSHRLMRARFKKNGRFVTAISVYAPTHQRTQEEKDAFWDGLRELVMSTPNTDLLLILGDFNARVGRGGQEASMVLGPYGPPETNQAGERLVEFCEEHDLVISSTYHPKAARGTWQHPPSRKWYLIDHVINKQKDAALVSQAIPIIPAECHTDHRLMRAKIKWRPLRAKVFSQPPQAEQREGKLDIRKLKSDETREEFNKQVRVELGVEAPRAQPHTDFGPGMVIYMDGSSTGRKVDARKGGWAFVVVVNGRQTELHFGAVKKEDVEVISNNSAELMAARHLLLWLLDHTPVQGSTVWIRPDSMLVIKWLTGVARSGHHKELIRQCRAALAQLQEKIIIKWKHVRAHRNHYWNESVDEHAKAGADGYSTDHRPAPVQECEPQEDNTTMEEARHIATCFAAALHTAGTETSEGADMDEGQRDEDRQDDRGEEQGLREAMHKPSQ